MARSTVTGDRELLAALAAVGQSPSRQLDLACRISLDPMRISTIENARRHRRAIRTPRGGHLDQGVVIARIEARGGTFRVFWLSFRRRARRIAHLVEFGTAPHWQPRRMRMHPGARPFPFFRPAFEANKHIAAEIFGKSMWSVIRSTALRFGTRGRGP